MTLHDPECAACRRLLQAYLDNELSTGDALTVAAHLATCAPCRTEEQAFVTLGGTIRATQPYFEAPADFLAQLDDMLAAAATGDTGAAPETAPRTVAPRMVSETTATVIPLVPPGSAGKRSAGMGSPGMQGRVARWLAPGVSLVALAASLMLYLAVPPAGEAIVDEAVADHVRSLMADHLTDIASSDRHTVAPWFTGKLDFAPPVHDFADREFPLIGGRLDYLDHRPVAALTYQHKKHVINLLIAPAEPGSPPDSEMVVTEEKRGYTVLRWRRDHLRYYMISDVNGQDLVTLWHLLRDEATRL